MSRFGPDPRAFFKSVYQAAAPWEIGGVQPAMAALIEQFPPGDPVLDVGCASGDLAIHLAGLGHEVLGVDFVERAIEQANGRRSALPDDVARRLTFEVADAALPSALGQFGSVFDSGFLHLLDAEESDRYVADLSLALVPGGRLYLHEFAVEFPIENVPRAITEDELHERFTQSAGWRVLQIAQVEFLNTVAAPTPAVAACVERL
ncbi:MAG: class I SAM-dependent methyltransferase [Coriobacteriia bacterium]